MLKHPTDKMNTQTTIDFNVHKLGALQYPMGVMLFLRIINTGIRNIFIQVTVANVPPVAHVAA